MHLHSLNHSKFGYRLASTMADSRRQSGHADAVGRLAGTTTRNHRGQQPRSGNLVKTKPKSCYDRNFVNESLCKKFDMLRINEPQKTAKKQKPSGIWGCSLLMLPPPAYRDGMCIDAFAGLICYQCFGSDLPTPVRPTFNCSACDMSFCSKHRWSHEGCP